MILPDNIEPVISRRAKYLDLRGLSEYSSLGIPTLREYLKSGSLSYFKLKGKILVRVSEFEDWLEGYRVNKKEDLNHLVDDVLEDLMG